MDAKHYIDNKLLVDRRLWVHWMANQPGIFSKFATLKRLTVTKDISGFRNITYADVVSTIETSMDPHNDENMAVFKDTIINVCDYLDALI